MKAEDQMTKSERNPKFEARSAGQILAAFTLSVRHSDFGLLSAFGFRHSDF